MKKNFRKYLEDILKSFYLCIRFPEKKADIKEAIFEEIYINNDTVKEQKTQKKGERRLTARKTRSKPHPNKPVKGRRTLY